MTNAPEMRAPVKGKVRVPRFYGFWEVKTLDSGKTQIIHQVFSDPGGGIPGIPAWLTQAAVVAVPYHSKKNLKARVEP